LGKEEQAVVLVLEEEASRVFQEVEFQELQLLAEHKSYGVIS
jgi:hypothetical protein